MNTSEGPETPGLEPLPTREGYDRWAEIYDGEDNPLIQLETPIFRELAGDVHGLRLLDAGCGTGRHAIALAAAGADVTAMDFSAGMLAKAREKPGAAAVHWVEHDLSKRFPFGGGYFDAVISCLVLDHIADLKGFFQELGRSVRDGGMVVLTVMHPAMMLRGVQARFTDPRTGKRVLPAAMPNRISDYVMAALQAGLAFERLNEYAVDDALIARSPRAAKHAGWPLLLTMKLRAVRNETEPGGRK